MNQKLVESLVWIILSLSEEERHFLEQKIRSASTSQQVAGLEEYLKRYEEHYQMSSQDFCQQFRAGKLGDSADFFEWNIYYTV